jgi:hypothetical protein
VPLITIYLIIEFSFLCKHEVAEGGYVTLFIALSLISVTIWYLRRLIKVTPKLLKLKTIKSTCWVECWSIPKYAAPSIHD